MTTPDPTPAGGPPAPERDHFTISSVKRTLCAALLIHVSQAGSETGRVRKRTALTATAGGFGVLVICGVAAALGIDLPGR